MHNEIMELVQWQTMTHRERFNRVMHFQEVDRIPNEEFGYWGETLERWRGEGMPADADGIFRLRGYTAQAEKRCEENQ